MGSFEFSILMISVFVGIAGLVVWLDNNAMHKAEHDDRFHEHVHN